MNMRDEIAPIISGHRGVIKLALGKLKHADGDREFAAKLLAPVLMQVAINQFEDARTEGAIVNAFLYMVAESLKAMTSDDWLHVAAFVIETILREREEVI